MKLFDGWIFWGSRFRQVAEVMTTAVLLEDGTWKAQLQVHARALLEPRGPEVAGGQGQV